LNRLVAALLRRPEVVDTLTANRVAGFSSILEMLGSSAIFGDRNSLDFGSHSEDLDVSYLPVIRLADWRRAVSRAHSPDEASIRRGWRSVVVRGTAGSKGLVVPQAYSRDDFAALFAGPEERPRVLRVNLERGSIRSVAGGRGHCSPPVRGACAAGACGGCRTVTVWDPSTGGPGLACRCPDSE
jgi:hypothetical protein